MALSLKSLSEICYMEVFCKQLWREAEELGDGDSEVETLEEPDTWMALKPSIVDGSSPLQSTKMKNMQRRNKLLTKQPRKSLLVAQMISVEQAMNTQKRTSTHALSDSMNTARQHSPTRRFRELPACANVPTLGRLATPMWKAPTVDDPPVFRSDGRLRYTFGRKCLNDYWRGSQTERLSTRHHLYAGAPSPTGVEFHPKVKCVAFPAQHKCKYVTRMPPLSTRTQAIHDPSQPAGLFRAPMSTRGEERLGEERLQRTAVLPTPPIPL